MVMGERDEYNIFVGRVVKIHLNRVNSTQFEQKM